MAAPELHAVQSVAISVSSDHYVRLAWWVGDTLHELKLNPGQALAVGGFANLAKQAFEFAQKENS